MLLEWENGNILNGVGRLLMGRDALIEKSAFKYLVKFCESQMDALA
jgi:hypothetical protein